MKSYSEWDPGQKILVFWWRWRELCSSGRGPQAAFADAMMHGRYQIERAKRGLLLACGVVWSLQVIGAEIKTDIVYGRVAGERLLLDANVPDGQGPFPVAIIVHGGGWTGGDKQRDITPFSARLTKANFTWFSINYRLAPKHHWPAAFEDVQTAIRWVKAHAAEYKGDPHRIALIGYSAGGHLVSLAATTAGSDTRVQAVVAVASPADLAGETERTGELPKSLQDLLGRTTADKKTKALLREISPINRVRSGLPPFLLIHGTADRSVAFEQPERFQARLKKKGVRCELIAITNGGHSLSTWEELEPGYKDKMATWLERTLGRAR